MIDLISRRAAIDALAEAMPSLTTPDGCGQFDHDIQVTDEAYVDCMQIIHELPSAQPRCEDAVSRFEVLRLIDYSSHDLNDDVDNRYMQNEIKQLPSVTPKQSEWIPCSERCPAHRVYVLVTYKPVYGIPDIGITWYSKSERKWNTSREVLAWMSLPKPFGDKT